MFENMSTKDFLITIKFLIIINLMFFEPLTTPEARVHENNFRQFRSFQLSGIQY